MKLLFYRYGSICEPSVLTALRALGIQVSEETEEISNKAFTPGECARRVASRLMEGGYACVFSVNFYPAIADICNQLQTLYVCWTVDCPVTELFSRSILHPYNRIFLFDWAQYETFSPYNPDCIYYLPLCTDTDRWDRETAAITRADRDRYGADLSFVGSLYTEKSPLEKLSSLSDYSRGYIDALCESQLLIYGTCFLEQALSKRVVEDLRRADPGFYTPQNTVRETDAYVAAHQYVGMHLAALERRKVLERLSASYPVTLYTRSDASALPRVRNRSGVNTLHEMPRVFHLSRINLNITIRPIQTGLSLRVWDVLGCGGFLLTNYQAEIPEYFEIGRDLETWSDPEELSGKVEYYLTHESERAEIARNGYEKVKKLHTYEKRILEILRVLTTGPAQGNE